MTRLDDNQVGGDHYSKMTITPWEFLESCLTDDELRGYFKGEALVYVSREAQKGGPVDIGKARHVLQKLEEVDKRIAAKRVQPVDTPAFVRHITLGGHTAEDFDAMVSKVNAVPGLADIAAALQLVASTMRTASAR